MIPSRSRPEACLADFSIDQMLAHDLPHADEAAASAHLAECARCEQRFAELKRERAAFMADAPPLRLPRSTARVQPRRAWAMGAASALAVAAAAVLFVAFRGAPEDWGTRAKGSAPHLDYYVNHGGNVRRGAVLEQVVPGDRVRFVVTSREARYLAILSVDGAKHVSVYYGNGEDAAAVPVGVGVALPESTTLDETLGDETVYGVFCAAPFAVDALRHALEREPDRAPSLDGCNVETVHLRKEAPSSP